MEEIELETGWRVDIHGNHFQTDNDSGWRVDIHGHHLKMEKPDDQQPLLRKQKKGSGCTKQKLLIAVIPIVIIILASVTFVAVRFGKDPVEKGHTKGLKCGIPTIDPKSLQRKRTKRIVNGHVSDIKAFPWQAFLIIKTWSLYGHDEAYCGGTILNERWILSAGHCYDSSWTSVEVIVGSSYLHEGSRFEVEQFIRHPNYEHFWKDDISLLKLKTPLALDGVNISTICLPPSNSNDNSFKRCFFSGFGETSIPFYIFEDTMSRTIKQARQIIQNMNSCRKSIQSNDLGYLDKTTQVCVGDFYEKNSNACHGDSGGPLSCQGYHDDNWYVYGLVSWSNGFCTGSGLYTRVTTYIDWINKIINDI